MKGKCVLQKKILVCFFIVGFLGITFIVFSQTDSGPGDVNSDGVINIIDALLIAQYYVGLDPAVFDISAADVDLSGNIDIVDALLVARFAVGLISTLPPEQGPMDNPFEDARWYVDPSWSAQANEGGGSAIASYNTGIMIDYPGAVTNGIGLQGHMDEALARNANLIIIVLEYFPSDCDFIWYTIDSITSPYEVYTAEIIDPVTAILSRDEYKDIRKIMVLEPFAIAPLITNLESAVCREMTGPGGYVDMVRYAINQFNTIPNTYNYLCISQSGWLGWVDNFFNAADLITDVVRATNNGFDSVTGFISNTTNYTPLEEPFLPDPDLQVGNTSLKGAAFYEWNPYFDELDYVLDMRLALIDRGFPPGIGMLINTSRNGWGGARRPAGVSSSLDLETYVNESRVDQRIHRGNWCNQEGGMGERPAANPLPYIDAYVWAWPPGISDGISAPGEPDPDDPYKIYDQMCDPDATSEWGNIGTGALDGAPHRGQWFREQFEILLENAYPPII